MLLTAAMLVDVPFVRARWNVSSLFAQKKTVPTPNGAGTANLIISCTYSAKSRDIRFKVSHKLFHIVTGITYLKITNISISQ